MKISLLLILVLLSVSCSKEHRDKNVVQVEAIKSYSVSVPFGITLKAPETQSESKGEITSKEVVLAPELKALVDQIQSSGQVDFDKITNAFVEYHINDFKKKTNDRKDISEDALDLYFDQIQSLVGSFNAESDPADMKSSYMKLIEKEGKLSYNRNFTNIFNFFSDKKFQCYSGTSFFQLMAHLVYKKEDFANKHFVAIYEEGHVLPGRMELNAEGKWNLIGFESTVKGRGIKNYGEASTIKNKLVIDANHFMLIQVLKDVISNDDEIRSAMLTDIESRYGFKLDLLELLKEEKISKKGIGQFYKVHDDINADLISFGKSNTPEGDIELEEVSEFENASTTISDPINAAFFRNLNVEDLKTVTRCSRNHHKGNSRIHIRYKSKYTHTYSRVFVGKAKRSTDIKIHIYPFSRAYVGRTAKGDIIVVNKSLNQIIIDAYLCRSTVKHQGLHDGLVTAEFKLNLERAGTLIHNKSTAAGIIRFPSFVTRKGKIFALEIRPFHNDTDSDPNTDQSLSELKNAKDFLLGHYLKNEFVSRTVIDDYYSYKGSGPDKLMLGGAVKFNFSLNSGWQSWKTHSVLVDSIDQVVSRVDYSILTENMEDKSIIATKNENLYIVQHEGNDQVNSYRSIYHYDLNLPISLNPVRVEHIQYDFAKTRIISGEVIIRYEELI